MHWTCSFWTIEIPLFIKLIRGYISRIWCKIKFWLICLTLTWNGLFQKRCYKILSSKTWRKPKTWPQTQNIVQERVRQNNYISNYINYTPTDFINWRSCRAKLILMIFTAHSVSEQLKALINKFNTWVYIKYLI